MCRFLQDKLQISPRIEKIPRIGTAKGDRPRSVIIKMQQFRDKQRCLRLASKLKSTNVYLNEDVSKATLEIRKKKYPS